MGALDEYIERLSALPPKEADRLAVDALAQVKDLMWIPNPGPQTDAYFSDADETLYGGEAGGGKTALVVGLSLTCHSRSLVLRRTNKEAEKLFDDYAKIIGHEDGCNRQKGWRINGKIIDIGGCEQEKDKQKRKGIPHDLKCVGRDTPILMGDGSWKPVQDVVVGDQVATLEGRRRVLRSFKVYGRPAVVLRANVAGCVIEQVQAASHNVLTASGWQSWDSCPSIPSDVLSDLSICSQPKEYRASDRLRALARRIFQVPLKRLRLSSLGLPPMAQLAQAISDRLYPLGCGAFSAQLTPETCCEGSYALREETTRHPLSIARLAHPKQVPASGAPDSVPHSVYREAYGVRGASLPEGSADRCSIADHRDDAQLQYLADVQIVEVGDQALFQQSCGVAKPTPTGFEGDDLGNTPRHTRQRRTYPHPYGKGICSTVADLGSVSCEMSPIDVDELFDLEIEQVNHFITKGGIVNQNCFDELVDFTQSQYEFIIAWNRSVEPGQRCRIVATTNPPTSPEGMWVVKRWAAWLDPKHPNPAKSGELRWYTTVGGVETEVDGPGPHWIDGRDVTAKSRTFIRARLDDNPDLTRDGSYAARLDALPKELREAYREGKFDASLRDQPFQAVPTEWVRLAMGRWEQGSPNGVPMCAMGVDASGGGEDPMTIAMRYDGWFAPIVEIPGKDIPPDRPGKYAAGMVLSYRRDNAIVIVDMGGGYGGPTYEQLKENSITCQGYKGSEGSIRRTEDGQLKFKNKRTEAIWKFREALDPAQPGGSPIMLPDDQMLLADLCTPTFKMERGEIIIESKEDVCARLGRSTDRGDAVVMAWSAGPTYITDGQMWAQKAEEARPFGRNPQVVMGRQNRR